MESIIKVSGKEEFKITSIFRIITYYILIYEINFVLTLFP